MAVKKNVGNGKGKGARGAGANRKWRRGLIAGLSAAALLAAGVLGMYVSARTLHVRYAEVSLSDLPASFDGTTLLYASDIDMCGSNSPSSVKHTFDSLQSLQPDILLLGGSFASPSLLDRLNGGAGEGEQAARNAFFQDMADFRAPLGKFAVSGEGDGDLDALRLTMVPSGVQLIDGACAVIDNGQDAIGIVGMGAKTSGEEISHVAAKIHSDQCVIALMHSPSCVTSVRICESKDGGTWADLLLGGHTHGGQIQIGGRSMLTLTDVEKRYMSGWYPEAGPLLVNQGMGCEAMNLRFGSQSEVWMITLRGK